MQSGGAAVEHLLTELRGDLDADVDHRSGIPIGRVESVEKNGPAFKRIIVKPTVNFSQLEEVLVVVTPTPAKEAAAGVSE